MAYNHLLENHHLIQSLWHTVNTGSGSLEVVGPLVRKVLDTGAWREREVPGIGPVKFERLADFITSKPLSGCGWNPDKVTSLIHDDLDLLTKWQEAMVAPKGTNQHSDIVTTLKSDRGNSRADTLRRLHKDRPDLHARVVDGEMSANAAAIQAGFRHKPSPFEQVLKLLPKLTADECQQIKAKVEEYLNC